MKKIFTAALVFVSSFTLWAWEMPSRYFELGLDFEFGAANRSLTWGDIFNSAETGKIDLNKLENDDFSLDFLTKGNFFINVQTRGKYKIGVGIFSGFENNLFAALPQETMDLLINGDNNASLLEGGVSIGGSIFTDIGIRGTATINKWKFTVSPAVFIPLFYMTEPNICYSLTNGNPFSGIIIAKADVYTAFTMNDGLNLTMEDALAPKGFDISADLSYQLFPFLDLGGTVAHIPIVPAHMSRGQRIDKIYTVNQSGKTVQELIDNDELGSLLSPEPGEDDLVSFSDGNQMVFRPLRFDGYAVYKPFRDQLRLSLKPSIGLSFFTVHNKVYFNAGLETEFKFANMLGLTWDFRYREQIWLNKLGLILNFRILELDLGAGFRSPDLPGVFMGRGLYASCGVRLGF
jgi:hypothetical protein